MNRHPKNRSNWALLVLFFAVSSILQGAVNLTLSPNLKSVTAGQEERVNFTNTGASTGRYQMSFVSGRESWMTVRNDDNNADSGYIKLAPPVGTSGTFTVQIRANRFGSSTDTDTETLTVTVSAGINPLALSVGHLR